MENSLEKSTKTDLSSLNELQREAVISDEKRLLVLAGAGSGKTKTLLQKIIYLIEEKGVSPADILAITFTKNAANEMIDRLIISADTTKQYEKKLFDKHLSAKEKDAERYIQQKKHRWIDNLTIRTFHSFCYSALRHDGVKEFDNKFRIISDEKNNENNEELSKYIAPETAIEVFHKLLIEKCKDTEYLIQLKRFILDWIVDKIHLDKNKRFDFHEDNKYYTTLEGTRVRSKSEQYIADWFYRHNIKYVYEPELNIKDFTFHPDFYVPEADLYIEHISNKSAPTKKKEEQFKYGKLLLVKTYEDIAQDTTLFNQTLENIVKNRLPSNYHFSVALNFNEEFIGYHEDVKEFIKLVMRVTDMIKVEDFNLDDILTKVAKSNFTKDQHERVRNFYELAIPIVKLYNVYCVNKSYLDFNDLISRCISLFNSTLTD